MKCNMVILSSLDWSAQWDRHQRLASMFASIGWNVLFVDSSARRNPRLNDFLRILKRLYSFVSTEGIFSPENVPESLKVIAPLVLPPTYQISKRINKNFLVPRLIKNIKNTIRNDWASILWCYLPTYTSLYIIDGLSPDLLIYDCTDNFAAMKGSVKDILDSEREIIKKADVVFTTSEYLYNDKKKYREDIIKMPPGVEYAHFNSIFDWNNINEKKVTFFGGINDRIDFNIIKKIADAGYEVLMIGSILVSLPKLPPNVKFTGSVPFKNLPPYLKDSFCFIIPYHINEYTKRILPVKIYECFATGKPVISTSLPDLLAFDKDLLYIADGAEEFLHTLNSLKLHETEEKRLKRKLVAYANTWDERFREIQGIIESRLYRKDGA